MKAIWNDTVIAESDETIVVEGNHYFPHDAIKKEHFEKTEHTSVCPWKGTARYYSVKVDGKVNENAAWYYPEAKHMARNIENYVAFWKGVEVME